MEIQHKNLKHAEFMSHETECFQAAVYINGEKAGTVSNDGHGGANLYIPEALYLRLREHCQSIPPDMAGGRVTPDEVIGNILQFVLYGADYDFFGEAAK